MAAVYHPPLGKPDKGGETGLDGELRIVRGQSQPAGRQLPSDKTRVHAFHGPDDLPGADEFDVHLPRFLVVEGAEAERGDDGAAGNALTEHAAAEGADDVHRDEVLEAFVPSFALDEHLGTGERGRKIDTAVGVMASVFTRHEDAPVAQIGKEELAEPLEAAGVHGTNLGDAGEAGEIFLRELREGLGEHRTGVQRRTGRAYHRGRELAGKLVVERGESRVYPVNELGNLLLREKESRRAAAIVVVERDAHLGYG